MELSLIWRRWTKKRFKQTNKPKFLLASLFTALLQCNMRVIVTTEKTIADSHLPTKNKIAKRFRQTYFVDIVQLCNRRVTICCFSLNLNFAQIKVNNENRPGCGSLKWNFICIGYSLAILMIINLIGMIIAQSSALP